MRQPKKTETVEFRLPYDTKQALMAQCRANGRTVSEAIRDLIERDILNPAPGPKRGLGNWRAMTAAVLAGLALGAVAAPSLAQQDEADRISFDRLDHDRDGRLSFDEFRAR